MKTFFNYFWTFLTIVFLVAIPANPEAAEKTLSNNETNTYKLLNLFGDAFERIRKSYVSEVSDERLIEAAINGMLTSLDPHSAFLNAKNFKDMRVQTRGKFGGLGIEVTMEGGLIKVVSPIDQTPAQRAGLKPGDLITHLDDKTVQGLTLSEAVDKMRGRVGEKIKLKIFRTGQKPFDVTIIRAIIPIRTVRSRVVDKNIGYIRISAFNQPTEKELKREFEKIKRKLGDQFSGLILDLRNNPGGLLDQAIAVSDAFLEKGEIVSTRSRRKEEHQRFNARPGDITNGKPMVVLINEGSASASEIVAGALQDHKRAIVLGTQSFGKGSVQTIIPLQQKSAMRLTTSRYYTPSGRSIQEIGVAPDIKVEPAKIRLIENQKIRREGDLRGALKNNNKREGAPSLNKSFELKPKRIQNNSIAEKTTEDESNMRDFQLQRALDLLRGISLFSGKIMR